MNSEKNSFVERLKSYDSPVPEDMFERLNLPQKPKSNNTFLMYWFLAIAAILMALLLWWGMDNFKQSTAGQETNVSMEQHRNRDGGDDVRNYNTDSRDTVALDVSEKESSDKSNLDKFTPAESEDSENSDANIALTKQHNNVGEAESRGSAYTGRKDLQMTGQGLELKEDFTARDGNSARGNSPGEATEGTLSPSSSADSEEVNTTVNNNAGTAINSASQTAVAEDEFANTQGAEQAGMEDKRALPDYIISPLEKPEAQLLGTPGMAGGYKCPDLRKVDRDVQDIEIYGGVTKPYRTLSMNSDNGENPAYIDSRNENEQVIPGYRAGILYRMRNAGGFSIASGLEYQLHEELFSYRTALQRETTIQEIYDIEGNVVRTDTVVLTGYTSKEIYNKFHRLSVPVLLGYTHYLNQFFIRAELGGNIILWKNQRGEIFDYNNVPYDIGQDEDGIFNSGLGIGVTIRCSMGYYLTPSTQFFIGPQYIHDFMPISSKNAMVKQSYSHLSLNFGLTISMGRGRGF